MWPHSAQQGNQYGDHDGRASHEDAGYRGFGGAFRGEHREVEADHADGGEQRESAPLARREPPQRAQAALPEQWQEQQARDGVADELAAGVRVVAQDAVGGEGAAHEDAGEGGEQGASE